MGRGEAAGAWARRGVLLGAMAAAGCGPTGPAQTARATVALDLAGTPCAGKAPTAACCEAAATRAFARHLSSDDGTDEGRLEIPGEFEDLAKKTLAADKYRVHELARGSACEKLLPVPKAFTAMRDLTPSEAEAKLRARAQAACARASRAAASVKDPGLLAEASRARACVFGGDERPTAACTALLADSLTPGVIEVVVCRDVAAAVPIGARTLTALMPAVERVEALEARAAYSEAGPTTSKAAAPSEAARADAAWAEVVEPAAEIAENLVRDREVRASTEIRVGELAHTLDRMDRYRAAVRADHLCPARKRFVAGYGEDDLAKRASKRCALPSLPAGAVIPAEETLCRAVVAEPCP